MDHLSMARRSGWLGLAVVVVLAHSSPLPAQVPTRIPSDPEAQIFDLIKRVTALEEQLSALTSGRATLRVKAPFQVVDAGGDPILQVLDGQAAARGGDPSGVVIANDAKSGVEALLIHNNAGDPVVLIGATEKGGGIGLNDAQGKTRLTMTGAGKLTVSDKEGNSLLVVADDVSKEDANIRIGGDDGGFAIQVGDGNGVATLGTDDDGVAELSLLDAQNRERVGLNSEGTLQVSDATGRDILVVAADVAGDSAGVAISGGKNGGIVRVADRSGKPAAGILGDKRAVVIANSTGKVVAEMVASSTAAGLFQVWGEGKVPLAVMGQAPGNSGGIVQVSNGQVPVSSILASEGGAGRWQLNDASGAAMVEAGVTTQGKGTVRAGPRYMCGMSVAAVGVVGKAVLPPDCIVGVR